MGQRAGWATQPLHATSSLLEPADDGYLAFDYLVDAAARHPTAAPIPDAVWQALLQHAQPAETVEIAWQASFAGRIEHVELAFARAFASAEYTAAARIAGCLGEAGRESRAIDLLETTIAKAEASPTVSAEDMLAMRSALAWQVGNKVGERGDPKRALEIAEQVVRDSTVLHGAAHRKTLAARITLARQVGAVGEPHQALAIARDVDAESTAALGADDRMTLRARFEVAVWTRGVDGAAASAARFAELVRQAEQLKPQPQSLIIDAMWNLGECLSDAGDHVNAVKTSQAAIDKARLAYGDRYIYVLEMRLTHIRVVGLSGDTPSAVALGGRLANDCAEILGESHLTTLEARLAEAHWTASAGNHGAAADLYDALQSRLAQVVDDDHWLAQQCRAERAELKKGGPLALADESTHDAQTNRQT
jgi:hypothetical protein